MRTSAMLLRMAWPRTQADHTRLRIAAAAVAVAGAFVLIAARIARLGFSGELPESRFSNYLAEDGLRSGVAFGALMMALPAALLTLQALRLGTAARERRMAAFRLAGATPNQVRRVTAAEAALAGLIGGLLAGPLYLLAGLIVNELPRMARLVPPATDGDVLAWAALVVATAVLGAAAGWVMHRSVTDGLVAAYRGAPRQRAGTAAKAVAAAAVVVVAGGVALMFGPLGIGVLLPAGLLAVGPLIRWRGHRLRRSADPSLVLAGARLVADSRPASRMNALLLLCGAVLGFVPVSAADALREREDATTFWITGFGATAAGALLAVVTAVLSLTVGAADEVLRQKRQLASLVALGTEVRQLRRALRLQLTAVAPWATTVGAVAGGFAGGAIVSDRGMGLAYAGLVLATAVVAGALTWAGCGLAAQLLRGQLRDAVRAENLRAV